MFVGITSYKIHTSKALYDITQKCIESVERQTLPVEIHLADDSSDLTGPIEKQNVTVHKCNWSNLQRSVNFLLRKAFYNLEEDWAVILNNDIVLQPTAIEGLLSYIKKYPQRKFLAAKEACGHKVYPFSAFAMHRSVFEIVGPLDEQFLYNWGDVDYAHRFHLVASKRNDVSSKISIVDDFLVHHERSSTGKEVDSLDTDLESAHKFYLKWNYITMNKREYDAYVARYGEPHGEKKNIKILGGPWENPEWREESSS